MQLFTCEMADSLGKDVGQPRNLEILTHARQGQALNEGALAPGARGLKMCTKVMAQNHWHVMAGDCARYGVCVYLDRYVQRLTTAKRRA